MFERTGEAFEFGDKLTVVGKKLQIGDTAPDFELDHLDPQSEQMSKVKLSDTAGKVRLLNVINSIDTPVCHVETHRWESSRSNELPDDVVVYTISMDLAYAQARWNKNENVKHQALSSHKSEKFGQDYMNALQNQKMSVFKEKYRKYDLLIMDDIQFFSDSFHNITPCYQLFLHVSFNESALAIKLDGSSFDNSANRRRYEAKPCNKSMQHDENQCAYYNREERRHTYDRPA